MGLSASEKLEEKHPRFFLLKKIRLALAMLAYVTS